jgi:adenylosuccinate synthase
MRNDISADVVIGLQAGDESKGKITNTLLKTGKYTHCIRWAGGHNAGHTIYKDGKKLVTHVVPTGVVQGVRSIIGPGCVVNIDLLTAEIEELKQQGIDVRGKLFVDKRAHIITDKHLEEDRQDTAIGTTKRGNGPAYRDKYNRAGIRFEDMQRHRDIDTTDIYNEIHNSSKPVNILFEGAQGFGLDIDWGDYPYVTSSTCNIGGAVSAGVPPQSIKRVFGVAKAYQTYVGTKKFQPQGQIFNTIREAGSEYGATTGRPRQVNYFDFDAIVMAINVNGVTDLIISKTDILQQVNEWKLYKDGKVIDLRYEDKFIDYIKTNILKTCSSVEDITFSYSPSDI